MAKTISTEKLQTLRKSAEGFLLIDVTSKESFDKDHIPGARSVPLDVADFVGAVAEKASGSKARKVVLYCSGPDCDASTKAVKKLVGGGFTSVIEYEGGLAAWNESKKARLARAGRNA
ncbi:MAG: rhodanese-like domain-containing protein [Planctomycetes bacterium]|nr:rhodanese-like domain-containing protein [Planctomycetota bacterium]